ncbi:Uncharacterized conserved protein UCP015417, vWA [Dillenia turbinata]|uniref:Uncharacterized conserved protein UCP015417, vWA n=1 Tax=Dillenia turbinata TaxID=194707 RepID=A0AAN8UBZ0_9MAGN
MAVIGMPVTSHILGDPFSLSAVHGREITAIDGDMNSLSLKDSPAMGFTEKGAVTYMETGNPSLDFFFQVVPSTPESKLIEYLERSWRHNPLVTLKLVANLRGVRGTGKSDKEGFYTASLWLFNNHPKTLALNVGVLGEFGYFKDLLEILYRILEGSDVRTKAKELRKDKIPGKRARAAYFKEKKEVRDKRKRERDDDYRREKGSEERVSENLEKGKKEKEEARVLRKEKELAKSKKVFEKYTSDPNYRFLHDKIAEVFALLLKSDVEKLHKGEIGKISLASKWCPTIDSSYDKATLICETISRILFPRNLKEYEGLEERQYLLKIRDRLRKEILVPLHKAMRLPEVYMSANEWNLLPYDRVASVAMKNYKTHFLNHDRKRFKQYLENVQKGEAKIAAGALLPHEIIASLNDSDGGQVAELQWKRMVNDMKEKGALRDCIAVCDVSGSMSGTPMEVCVALGLLVSELSEEPWKGRVITFHEDPQIHRIEGDTLLSKTKFVREMDWGGNTDFQKVFDRLLDVAVAGRLSEEQMIKTIFVFSDMEFDSAAGGCPADDDDDDDDDDDGDGSGDTDDEELWHKKFCRKWETDYQIICRKFKENGYNKVPQIVFWNLRDSKSTPVPSDQSGVALLSGFSKNLLTLFLEKDGVLNPVDTMVSAISGELYQKLAVYD